MAANRQAEGQENVLKMGEGMSAEGVGKVWGMSSEGVLPQL